MLGAGWIRGIMRFLWALIRGSVEFATDFDVENEKCLPGRGT